MTKITADQAEPGDVVLGTDGQVYQLLSRDCGVPVWMQMELVPFEGDPWNPEGELTLIARNASPVEGTTS